MFYEARITIFGHPKDSVHYRRTDDEESIYNLLEPIVGHEIAADAAAWCPNAPVGNGYSTEDFEIEVLDCGEKEELW